MKRIIITCCSLLVLQSFPAQAERADALKNASIKSSTVFLDNSAHNTIATGNVLRAVPRS